MSERTSIESYREAHASGLIGKRQLEELRYPPALRTGGGASDIFALTKRMLFTLFNR
jgi:hypothetical protein